MRESPHLITRSCKLFHTVLKRACDVSCRWQHTCVVSHGVWHHLRHSLTHVHCWAVSVVVLKYFRYESAGNCRRIFLCSGCEFLELDLITRTIFGEQYISWSSSLHTRSSLHSPVTSSLLDLNILQHPQLHSSLNVSDQVSHPYKTTGKFIMYILIFKFLDSKLEDKRFCIEWLQAFPDFNLLLISSWIEFWFFKVVPLSQMKFHQSVYFDFFLLSVLKTLPCTFF